MKTLFTLLLSICIAIPMLAQQRPMVDKSLRDIAVKKQAPILESNPFQPQSTPMVKAAQLTPVEDIVGPTRYDVQANAALQNRIHKYEDGTIGVTWTYALNDAASYDDRGAGYNFFDGIEWGDPPFERVEDERCGWPSYAPWGENGEIVVSHTGGDGYKISKRTEKGTGDWEYELLAGPPDHEYLIWNRSITSGVDRSRLHVISLTASTAYQGTVYEGLDGALTYSYSDDGGETWPIEHEILDGMTADEYFGFNSDNYTWAEPRAGVVAFIVGAEWHDMFLMKSTDGGETFEKTLIWEHPYPLYDFTYATDTLYCSDGAHHVAIDDNGKVHVVFGINRTYADDAGSTFWFPFVDGVGYWNEDMPAFSDDLNALSPYDDPGSEMIEDYNLIAWAQDVDGDGEVTYLDDYGIYYLGLSSMPQIVIGQNNDLYVVWSAITETYDNGLMNYRHLWARMSPDGGTFWSDFFDITSDLVHIFDECVYPSCSPTSDDNIYLVYQQDNEPGNAVWGAQHAAVDNNITVMQVSKDEITNVKEHKTPFYSYDVRQNIPNPFSGSTRIEVNVRESSRLELEVTNMTGQVVYRAAQEATPGMNKFYFSGEDLAKGVYFYTVRGGESSVTKKMIVE